MNDTALATLGLGLFLTIAIIAGLYTSSATAVFEPVLHALGS